jgi:hypothetical protein
MKVEAWGGGGSGGNQRDAGSGGGAYARSSISGPFSASYPNVIGGGGNNSNGGLTTFGTGPVRASAGGGAAGSNNSPTGGLEGVATIGNESLVSGQTGTGRGVADSGGAGGNGGAAGSNGNPGVAGSPTSHLLPLLTQTLNRYVLELQLQLLLTALQQDHLQ